MTLTGLKRPLIVCVSALAMLSTAACAHDTKFQLASNGGGGSGIGDDGGGGGTGGDGGADGDGGGADDGSGGGGGDGGSGDGGGSGGATPAGGLTQTAELLTGTVGNVVYSTGNTVKTSGELAGSAGAGSPAAGPTSIVGGIVTTLGGKTSDLGSAVAENGVTGLPVAGELVSTALPMLDSVSAPAAKITVIGNTLVGSGTSGSEQLIGVNAGDASAVQGTLASASLLGGTAQTPGPIASANVAGGQIVSVSALPNSTGLSGEAPTISSLADIGVSGTTLLPGGEGAAISVNALPGGASGLSEIVDLSNVLSPVTTGLAPVLSDTLTDVGGQAGGVLGGSTSVGSDPLGAVTGILNPLTGQLAPSPAANGG
jgi:hypothetical protein